MLGGACAAAVGCGLLSRSAYNSHRRAKVPSNVKYSYNPPPSRENMLNRMKATGEVFDLVVVGGGATGSGLALDAATRGMKCALLEADDFACGTSSRSTKLIHGGIRYLQTAMMKLDIGMFKLVCEALEERSHIMRAAPYMARPIPILMPVYRLWEVPMFWVGVKLYDWIGKVVCFFKPGLPNCFWISRSNSTFFFPLLNPKRLKGSIVYYDGQMNDARLNLQLATTASIDGYIKGMKGAAVANHCRVLQVSKLQPQSRDNKNAAAYDIEVQDTLTGAKFTVKAKAVANCTGPLSDEFRLKADSQAKKLVAASSGVHLTLPDYYSSSPFGMIIPETTDGRVLYYLPWEGATITGTTDEPVKPTSRPKATTGEVDFIVKESCRYLSVNEEDVRRDLRSTWSGLRPLVTNPKVSSSGGTAALSRSHEVFVENNGVVSVMGGKWTTYRKMAEDAIDKIVSLYGKSFSTHAGPSKTKFLLLANAIDPTKRFKTADVTFGSGRLPIYLHHTFKISIEQARHLACNYGFRAIEICSLGDELLQPLVEGHQFLKAEVVHAVRNEMARTPSDVLARRLRLAFLDSNAATNVLDEVVKTMAGELHWSPQIAHKMRKEGQDYLSTMKGGM